MTRELSELAATKAVFRFKITSLNPLNTANKPDAFEQTALSAFSQGSKVRIPDESGHDSDSIPPAIPEQSGQCKMRV